MADGAGDEGGGPAARAELGERRAVAADRDWLWALYRALLRAPIDAQWGWDEDRQRAFFGRHLPIDAFSIVSLGAEDVAAWALNRHGADWHLRMVLVAREWQRRGLGRAVVENIQARAGRVGCGLELSVIEANPVHGFYRRLGFVAVGRDGGCTLMRWPAPR